ncbi:MAG: tagaturonate reductase [Bacteroidota bacterium]|nr:tagaturonate reductase [Bacteroidota bacterium]
MKLSRYTLKNISSEKVIVPEDEIFDLPEKVLQFGTGVLLRGLPDSFIDKANMMGIFNGRIVIVKTTSKGDASAFDKQDGLYTLCERGIQDGAKVEEYTICSSVSRVLAAQDEWGQVLECAHNEHLKIIISNTTEVGIQLVNDDIRRYPPSSFPGKLLAFLYERYIAFNGSKDSGFVIVPTELITDNAKKLESIVLELAHLNSLEDDFIEWIEQCNFFCNSLVDRIVTGMPDEKTKQAIENDLGYKDELLIVSEIYSLWAIEGDEKVKNILSFAEADDGVVIEPNIDLHRELKLRLLNGTHTLTCGLAYLAGYDTVLQAMEDELSAGFIADLMSNELAPSIPYVIDESTKQLFISKVLDRFRNPHINHNWKNITLNYTSKMRMRCIPLLINYYNHNEVAPQLFSLGFASYLYFMKVVKQSGKDFFGELNGVEYLIEDVMAEKYHLLWQKNTVEGLVKEVLKDVSLWGQDLSHLPGFSQSVINNLNSIISDGMKATLIKVMNQKKLYV